MVVYRKNKCIYYEEWKFYFVVFNHGHNITAQLKIMIDGREHHKNLEFIKNLQQGFFLVIHDLYYTIGELLRYCLAECDSYPKSI